MTLRTWLFFGLGGLLLASCATVPAPGGVADAEHAIPAGWTEVVAAPRFEALSYDPGGVLLHVARTPATAGVRVVKDGDREKLVNGDKELTPPFPAIDSFDVSTERREVVFSARRADNFDVGLVSLDGSDIHWVPSDPMDEVAVQWAPRGNKISYVVRTAGGDLVRTVHVPTSMQLTALFPYGRVHALAWDPRGEHYAVSWSSVDASDRIEVMAYSGEDRRMSVPAAAKLDAEVEATPGGLLLRPMALRYNQKIPLVVWRAGDRNEWSDARAAMQRNVSIACAVVDHDPDDAFWAAVRAIPWIDLDRVYVIGVMAAPQKTAAPANAIRVVGDPSVPVGRYRSRGNVVGVAPALVQSFGAAWVTHQLKGNPPANGSHR